MRTVAINDESQTLHLPRILCLHGGGTNAKIFRAQCRVLKLHLSTTFRLVFAEAPFPSRPGPDVISVYKNWAPFKSWLISLEDNQYRESQRTIRAIEDSLSAAMENDNQSGGAGEWVGLLGFSQGAKICASLLLCQQMRAERLGVCSTINWSFAILLAGSGPLVALDQRFISIPGLVDPSNTSMTVGQDAALGENNKHVLDIPTVHVHGTQDPGLLEHRKLLTQYCGNGTARLMEWDGDHRVPIKTQDVLLLVGYIFDVAYKTGTITKEDVASNSEIQALK